MRRGTGSISSRDLETPTNLKMRTLKENIPDLKITDQLVKVPLTLRQIIHRY